MSSLARLIYGAYERMGRDPASYYEDASNELYQLTLSVVRRFQRETLEDGAERSIVVLFPRRRDLGRLMAGGQPYWSGLAEELRDGGISVLDMAEPLLKAARTEGLDSLFAEFHYGPHANRIVAQSLADALGTSMTTR
jgi:hypothetical protein